jgi:iron complex outermembrane receptor protein
MAKRNVLAVAGGAALVSTLFLTAVGPAHAQAAADDHTQDLEQVVVNARRTEELARTVPLSVTAISAEALQRNTIQAGLDLQKMVPTLSVVQGTQASAATFALRGIRNGVLTYFDETPSLQTQAGAAAVNYQLFDLASVQAISGPQGTLFGRNSTGGAILFVPKRPTREFEASIDIGAGNYSRREGTATINLPLHDMVQVRLGGQMIRRDGIVENMLGRDLQSQHRDAFRASALFTPVEWLTNYTLVDGGNTDETQFGHITSGYPGGSCPTTLFACFYGTLPIQLQAEQEQRGIRKVATPFPETLEGRERGVENVLTADIGEYTLKYIFAYRSSRIYQLHNQLSFPIPAVVGKAFNESDQRTHELQLSGPALGHRLRWVTGVFYRNNHSDNENASMLLAPLTVTTFTLAKAQISPVDQRNESKAAYAQGTYKLTDALGLTLGVRYTQDDQEAVFSSLAPGFRCILNPAVRGVDLATCTQPQSGRFHATTYNVSLDYELTPDVFLFATTRKGYNPGGFNQGLDPTAAAYDPEVFTDYEVGIKADWRIGRMPARMNLSTFYGKYEDIQRQVSRMVDTATGPRAFVGIFNAAEATIYGSQLEFQLRPFKSLMLSGSYGYLHTKYDRFIANTLQADASGNSFAQAPEHTANVSATYSYPCEFAEFVASASYAYVSKVTFSDANIGRGIAFEDPYGLVDARLELRQVVGRPLNISVWGKNLTDRQYRVNISDQPAFGFTSNVFGDPRTYGVNMKYWFGAK